MSFLDNFRKRKYKQKIKIATDLVKEGKNKEAIDAYNEAFKSLINLGDYVSLACLYVDEGEYNKAIDIFNDVIIKIQSKGLDKDLADIHFGLGVCYDSLRQINKAIENYEKAISEGKISQSRIEESYNRIYR